LNKKSKYIMTLDDALQKIGDKIVTDAKANLEKHNKIATGKLRDTIKAVVNNSELSFKMTNYAYYVDKGRKKGKFAPPQAIRDWCKVKGIDQRLAYVINRSIMENGIKPTFFFSEPFNKNMQNIDDMIDNYMDDLFDAI
jgi:hypothetical protein